MRLLLAAVLAATMLRAQAEWSVSTSSTTSAAGRGLTVREAVAGDGTRNVTLTAILFSDRNHTLRVIDSPDPGNTRLADVLKALGVPAGVNGGYFHDSMEPVGLVISGGKVLHRFEKAKLLAGVLVVRPSRMEIVRSSAFQNDGSVREALQCGPMLVENGHPVVGLNAERNARRTVVATNGRGQWALVYMTSVSLAGAAEILSTPGVLGEWQPRIALNLDGGGSSGLWIAAEPGPVSRPEFSHVRNYLGVVPR